MPGIEPWVDSMQKKKKKGIFFSAHLRAEVCLPFFASLLFFPPSLLSFHPFLPIIPLASLLSSLFFLSLLFFPPSLPPSDSSKSSPCPIFLLYNFFFSHPGLLSHPGSALKNDSKGTQGTQWDGRDETRVCGMSGHHPPLCTMALAPGTGCSKVTLSEGGPLDIHTPVPQQGAPGSATLTTSSSISCSPSPRLPRRNRAFCFSATS